MFGGDIARNELSGNEKQQSGPATPQFDLVAVNYGGPLLPPTTVLISCKSTDQQPNPKEIKLLADESQNVRNIMPGWLVFGALVNLGEPTADEFHYRRDVRIWKQSDLQKILLATEVRHIADFLWTPPWHYTGGV